MFSVSDMNDEDEGDGNSGCCGCCEIRLNSAEPKEEREKNIFTQAASTELRMWTVLFFLYLFISCLLTINLTVYHLKGICCNTANI